MDTHTRCQLVIDILQATHDGHTLHQTPEQIERWGNNGDGWQLAFLQDAVNGLLNDRGYRLLEILHRQVLAGDYCYPAQEFLTRFAPELCKETPCPR
jgi:hypothetical protein